MAEDVKVVVNLSICFCITIPTFDTLIKRGAMYETNHFI